MKNKVVLITGASGDIGNELVRVFFNADCTIVANYNKSQSYVENLIKELNPNNNRIIAYKADVTKYNEVKNMIEFVKSTFGHIDILINNAGIASYNLLIDESEANILNVINTNLIGTITTTKEVSKHMISQGFGKIINISSVWGTYGASCESIYSASKGGINAFTKAMAKELAYSSINVNAITPGVVNTKMLSHFSENELEELKKEIPLGRFASPNDIAELALFLASEKASYITGQIIQIDGGFCL